VQDRVVSGLKGRFGAIAGWKAGLTTTRMQQLCGVAQPIAGAILERRVLTSPATIRAADYVRLGVESELSFRVSGRPPAGTTLTSESIRAYLDLAYASFELIEDRAADYAKLDAASIIADNSWNAGVVLSQPSPVSDFGNFKGIRGALSINGACVDTGMTDDVGGDPLAIVAWLANFLAARGASLEPGQWVMTGSIVATRFPKAGDTYAFTLDGLAPAVLTVM
jgi:2-keto-4-pentenoate hydratase